jgi:hypothetical protein
MEINVAQLVVRAQTGDTYAFALLVQQHREEIVRLVRRFARGADDAQDLAIVPSALSPTAPWSPRTPTGSTSSATPPSARRSERW